MFVLFVGSTSEYRKGREQDSFEHSVCACMEGKSRGKEGGGHACRRELRYSQQRDASGRLVDA